MKHLIKLYKLHINSNPSTLDLHEFFSMFNLGQCVIKYPDVELQKQHELTLKMRQRKAEEWIYNNSKL